MLDGCEVRDIETEDRADAPGIQLFLSRQPAGWTLDTYFHATEYPAEVVTALAGSFLRTLEEGIPDA